MRLRLAIPEGRFCRWIARVTNPRRLITKLPFGVRIMLFFLFERTSQGLRHNGCRVWICR